MAVQVSFLVLVQEARAVGEGTWRYTRDGRGEAEREERQGSLSFISKP